MARQVYFVIAVDLDDKTIRIDDDTFMARFGKEEQVWDDLTSVWREDEGSEYLEALELLNTKKLEDD